MPIFQDQKQKNIANFQKAIDEKRYTISKNYDEIGRLYYGQFVDINVDNTKTINSKCDTITKLKDEIEELQQILRGYGFSFFDLADCSPKSNKTKVGCAKAVQVLLHDPSLIKQMRSEHKLPAAEILRRTDVQKKLLERHRKYIIAGTEILNGNYPQVAEYMAYIKLIQE